MVRSALQPGFRFHPTDEELVSYYLKRKVMGKPFRIEAISEVELYKFAPWDLPGKSGWKSNDLEWYFFCPRDRKYIHGTRPNRATDIGYWKTTGKDRTVSHKSRAVGMKKTLIFHTGKAPRGDRTDWVMYEYRLEDKELDKTQYAKDAYVLCKIFQKSGRGPKNAEQYGAPFIEEDWEDDLACENAISFADISSRELSVDHMLEPVIHQSGNSEMCSLPEISIGDGILLEQLAEILNSPPLQSGAVRESGDSEMCSLPEISVGDGILLEQLAEILNSPPLQSGAVREMPHLVSAPKEGFQLSGIENSVCNDIEEHTGQAELGLTDGIYLSDIVDKEYDFERGVPDLDKEQYPELNDFQLLENSNPLDLLLADDVFAHDPFEDTIYMADDFFTIPAMRGTNEPDFFNSSFTLSLEMDGSERSAHQSEDRSSIPHLQELPGGSDVYNNNSCS